MRRVVPLVMLALLTGCGSGAQKGTELSGPAKSIASPALPVPAEALPSPPLPVRGEGPPLPAPEGTLSRIAFGWGADQTGDLPIFAAVAAARPDLFVFMGDNVRPGAAQSSGPDESELGRLRWAYGEMNLNAHFSAFNMSTPVLATWGAGDSGGSGVDLALRGAAEAAFESYWGAGAAGADRLGVFGSRMFGPPGRRVQILMLDLWSFRSPEAGGRGPSSSLLGEAQWRWLVEELRRPAELRLVVSPMPVLPETEGWSAFPRERRRLLRTLAGGRSKGVIALTGGARPAILYHRRRMLGRPWPEVSATALSGSSTKEAASPSFGLLEIDWTERTVAISVRGMDRPASPRLTTSFADLGL